MWLADEEKRDTTVIEDIGYNRMLWLADEEKRDTTRHRPSSDAPPLWLADEEKRGYNDPRLQAEHRHVVAC